jgi:hypothetical protein
MAKARALNLVNRHAGLAGSEDVASVAVPPEPWLN